MSEIPKSSITGNAEVMTNAVYQTVDGRICEAYKYTEGHKPLPTLLPARR
jgi:hypothetical protein